MKVFISWSGARSRAAAQAIADWLPLVIQAVEPWISTAIDKGSRGQEEIESALGDIPVGIICLTRDNLAAPWIIRRRAR